MNQYLRYIEIYFELCFLWHVLSKRESLLSYLFYKKFIQEGEYTVFLLKLVRGRAYYGRGRFLNITKVWIDKGGENKEKKTIL